ncbi:MAG: hypothetical protein ACF8GE_07075 [Phycisphaerales bacterium JB043]
MSADLLERHAELVDATGRSLVRRQWSFGWMLQASGLIIAGLVAMGISTTTSATSARVLLVVGVGLCGLGVLACAVIYIQRYSARFRTRQNTHMSELGERHGLEFFKPPSKKDLTERERELFEPFDRLDALQDGIGGLNWILAGVIDGVEVRVVSHQYTRTTGSKGEQITIHHYAVGCAVPEEWPDVSVTPENIGTKILDRFGGGDRQLEEEEFNTRFRVSKESDDFVLLLLTPDVQRWMVERARERQDRYGLAGKLMSKLVGASESWHLTSGWLMCVESGGVGDAMEQIESMVSRPVEMVRLSGLDDLV